MFKKSFYIAYFFTFFSLPIFATEIPLEDFFKNPQFSQVQLSPSGNFIAYLTPSFHRLNITIQNLDTKETREITHTRNRDIETYFWVTDSKILYLQDHNGDENFHLYLAQINGKVVDLTPFEKTACFINPSHFDGNKTVLFAMNRRDKRIFDLYRLDLDSGAIELVFENPGNIIHFLLDHESKLRLAVTIDKLNESLVYREKETDPWQTLATYNFKEKPTPLLFTYDNQQIYVSSNVGRNTNALCTLDLKTGKETLLFEHPDVDVNNLLSSNKRKKITGVAFRTDKREYKHFDDLQEKIQNFIDEHLSGYTNTIVSQDREENKFIVHSSNSKTPGSYYLLDLEYWKLTKLFDAEPSLEEKKLADVTPISYRSRDGLTIHGYLTLPPKTSPRNLPLIVNPHGGPSRRSCLEYNPEVQFLANRGFAVLQMNFRGSTGYGRNFWERGFKEWGLAMQDDITDGVLWAIEQGIADPLRIGIYGGSYGGYAALAGIVKTPDLYAAAVDYAGISNLFTYLEKRPPYWEMNKERSFEMVGHPEKDQQRLIETSPCFHADKIKTPLLIAGGANDPRADPSHAAQMVEALKIRGVAVKYMLKDNEGHGFHNEENQWDFYREMEKFLKQHLTLKNHSTKEYDHEP